MTTIQTCLGSLKKHDVYQHLLRSFDQCSQIGLLVCWSILVLSVDREQKWTVLFWLWCYVIKCLWHIPVWQHTFQKQQARGTRKKTICLWESVGPLFCTLNTRSVYKTGFALEKLLKIGIQVHTPSGDLFHRSCCRPGLQTGLQTEHLFQSIACFRACKCILDIVGRIWNISIAEPHCYVSLCVYIQSNHWETLTPFLDWESC